MISTSRLGIHERGDEFYLEDMNEEESTGGKISQEKGLIQNPFYAQEKEEEEFIAGYG